MFSAMILAVAMTGQFPDGGFITPAPQATGQVVSQGYYSQSYSQTYVQAPAAPCNTCPTAGYVAQRAPAPAYGARYKEKVKFKARGGRRAARGCGGCG